MKPLSSLKYFMENKKRSSTVFVVLFLAVLFVSFITSLVTSITIDATKANLNILQFISYVTPTSNQVFLSNESIEKIENYKNVKNIFNVSFQWTYLNILVGNTSAPIVITNNMDEMKVILKEMDLTLVEGRMPNTDDFEILLHKRVLKNKNLKVGDFFGNDVDDNENLQGKYKIVGVIDGESIVCFANKNSYIESLKNQGFVFDKPTGKLLIPKAGKLNEMNKEIEQIDKKEASYTTYASVKKNFDKQLESLNVILFIVIVAVVFIISISISAMMYIVYMNRNDEFGILYAIGYRKSFIKGFIIRELLALTIFTWVCGYICSWILLNLINHFLLSENGQTLYFFTTIGLVNTLIIPIVVVICATFPILKKLKKWDPISIIERRE